MVKRVIDWMMFAAAVATDSNVRDGLISGIHAYASANMGNMPFPVVYSVSNGSELVSGDSAGGINR